MSLRTNRRIANGINLLVRRFFRLANRIEVGLPQQRGRLYNGSKETYVFCDGHSNSLYRADREIAILITLQEAGSLSSDTERERRRQKFSMHVQEKKQVTFLANLAGFDWATVP